MDDLLNLLFFLIDLPSTILDLIWVTEDTKEQRKMKKLRKEWEKRKQENTYELPCALCSEVHNEVIERYDKENDEIIYYCEECWFKKG